MSLTSYRAAPPRVWQGSESWTGSESWAVAGGGRGWAIGEVGGRRRGGRVGALRPRERSADVRASGPRALSRTPRQAWRRPALPPLGGQYPGRSTVSRPSSEWGRVVPVRCDHQAEPGVRRGRRPRRGQRSEVGGQTAPGRSCRRRADPRHPIMKGVVKLRAWVPEVGDQRAEIGRVGANGSAGACAF
jgi:hypothetical protein